jgi:hypothetical protein
MGKKDSDAKRKRKRAVFDSESEDDESGGDLEEVGSCQVGLIRSWFV